MHDQIPFYKPFMTGRELDSISECVLQGQTSGNGPYTRLCERLIGNIIGSGHLLLTTSCSSGLHIAALLCDLEPGDEVVMPAYCSPVAANAFLSVGARPVFADVDSDTLNIDIEQVESCLTDRTRVILPLHYSGTACDMSRLLKITEDKTIRVVEDVSEGFGARYHGKALGCLGDFGVFSFHETRDPTCGEGGAIVINNPAQYERAEIIREKGTNRSQFFRGQVDKYTWVDSGSSYVLSDLLAAFLSAQLETFEQIQSQRRVLYELYLKTLAPLAERGLIRLPATPADCQINYHGLFFLVKTGQVRKDLLSHLNSRGISAACHFSPLHKSTMGKRLGYESVVLPVTEDVSRRIVRLPFYHDLGSHQVLRVVQTIFDFYAVKADL